MIRALTERNEWKLATILPRADGMLAWLWWIVLILRGLDQVKSVLARMRRGGHTPGLEDLLYRPPIISQHHAPPVIR